MTRRMITRALSFGLCVIVVAGCASASNRAARTAIKALRTVNTTTTTPTTSTTAPDGSKPSCDEEHPEPKSTRPTVPTPPPGAAAAAGSSLATIQERGYLIAGVDENTLGLSFRNPNNGQLEGFEIDLLHELSLALFGDPDKVVYTTVTTEQKVPVVKEGKVDLTISAVSITCSRWIDVEFSTAYYETPQRVMVRAHSKFTSATELSHRTVCGTSGGTNEELIKSLGAKPYLVETRTDCLVALQEGTVAGILTHETFLRGFHAQDPNTRILDDELSIQLYGMAISWDRLDFVRYVNGLLEQWRSDGTLARLAESNFERAGMGLPQPIPEPSYRD